MTSTPTSTAPGGSTTTKHEQADTSMICVFTVGDQTLAIAATHVREVIRHPQPTPVPLAHDAVHGLVNLRGQVMSGICIRRRFAQDGPAGPFSIVVAHNHGEAALFVDTIQDVLDVDNTQLKPVPAAIAQPARHYLTGVHYIGDDIVGLVDVNLLVGGHQ